MADDPRTTSPTLALTRRATLAATAAAAIVPPPARADAATPPADRRGAAELAAALAAGTVSARALTDAAIARIEAYDALVNAVVVRDFTRARAAADAANAALARGERRPLLGVPMTVKEQFNVAGLPTTWGLEKFRDWRAPEDALAVQRLRAAGAIILGKTNVPANLSDWQSHNPVYGVTRNPYDPGRTPGGSSGGSAAALAAGLVPLELGSDIAGSLRAPAHFCGVCAHKPTLDLVPVRGSGYPATPAIAVESELYVCGPLARNAADLALALDVIAGPDPWRQGRGYRLNLPPPRHETLADYRVLVLDQHPLCPTATAMRDAVEALAGRLAREGCTVQRRHPGMPDLARTTRVYTELLGAFFAADLSADDRLRAQALASALAPENLSLRAAELRGVTMSHAAWLLTESLRNTLRAGWDAVLRDVDVILCPPMPTAAFPLDPSVPETDRKLAVDGRSISYGDQLAWCALATLCALPATVVPIAMTADTHLPMGVQIIGGYLEDRTTIGFASLIERAFGSVPPPLGFGA
jgi:amidase